MTFQDNVVDLFRDLRDFGFVPDFSLRKDRTMEIRIRGSKDDDLERATHLALAGIGPENEVSRRIRRFVDEVDGPAWTRVSERAIYVHVEVDPNLFYLVARLANSWLGNLYDRLKKETRKAIAATMWCVDLPPTRRGGKWNVALGY